MKSITNKIESELAEFSPVFSKSKTGSVYVSFSNSTIKGVRISDHNGHKLKQNVWQLRSDAMTSRKNPKNRVYNVKDLSLLISDFK